MDKAIEVAAPGWTVEQLYSESEHQFAMLTNLSTLIERVGEWFREAADESERTHLWEQYSGMCRDYTILMSWYNVTYSALIFAELGSELAYVSER